MSDIYAPPRASSSPVQDTNHGALAQSLKGQYQFSIRASFSEAWRLTNGMKWRMHLALLLYSLLPILFLFGFVAISLLAFIVAGVSSKSLLDGVANYENVPIWFNLLYDFYSVFSTALLMPMGVGLIMIGLKRAMGTPFFVTECFRYVGYFRPLFLVGLVEGVLVLFIYSLPVKYHEGFVILMLPGTYFFIGFVFAKLLVVEKSMTALAALKTSARVVRYRWFKFLGFMIMAFLWNILGALPLLLGLFWTIPMTITAFAIIYRDVFGASPDNPLFAQST